MRIDGEAARGWPWLRRCRALWTTRAGRYPASQQKLPLGQLGDAIWIGKLDVMAIEPVELVEVEDRGTGRDALKGEDLRQLRQREGLGLAVFRAPAEQGQVVGQCLGQVAHRRNVGDGSGSMALGEPLAVRARGWWKDEQTPAPANRRPRRWLPAWECWRCGRRRG